MPDAIDARLASLTLEGIDIGEFDPARTDYEGAIAEGVTETTVTPEALQRRTDIAIAPPDADEEAPGHQVSLEGLDAITVTVSSSDGPRERVYPISLGGAFQPVALEPGWNPVGWSGTDGATIAEVLEAGGFAGDVLAIFLWDGTATAWLGYFPDLEDVPALNTLTTFSSGQTYWVAAEETTDPRVEAASTRRGETAPTADESGALVGDQQPDLAW